MAPEKGSLKMKKSLIYTALGAAILFATPALAGSSGAMPAAGNLNSELLASNCVVCHGQGGASNGHIPGIDGYSKDEMIEALMDFKTGNRSGTIMPRIAPGYTDAQIEAIASEIAGN